MYKNHKEEKMYIDKKKLCLCQSEISSQAFEKVS